MSTEHSMMAMESGRPAMSPSGHLQMQMNEVRNAVVHNLRAPDGTITPGVAAHVTAQAATKVFAARQNPRHPTRQPPRRGDVGVGVPARSGGPVPRLAVLPAHRRHRR